MIMVWGNAMASPSPKTNASETETRRSEVLDVLRALLDERRDDAVVELVSKLVTENSDLQRRLAELLIRRRKGEGVSSAQLQLFLAELAAEGDETLDGANEKLKKAAGLDEKEASEKKKPPRQPRCRRPAPPDLRRIDNPIKVAEADRPCPVCGVERTCIGHDETEVIELIPAEVVVRVDRREKLACKPCEGELTRAPQADKVVEKGKFGCALVSTLLVDKYRDGLPLHRQKKRFEQLGLSVSVSTLADQVTWTTDLLRPLWRAASAVVVGSAVMQLDGTGISVRDKRHPAKLKMGTLWGYVGDETALYLYTSTGKKRGQRPGELGPEDMLSLRSGYTVADAANLFDASFRREALIECGCNMHARRYFKKALDAGDRRAALPIGAFKKLYDIEKEIAKFSREAKLAARQSESLPLYDELERWCKVHQPHEPPGTPMGAALRYLLNHRVALRQFLYEGILPMDNGAVERLHIRVALTRKNFLFAGSDTGAERAAIAYTILGCCALVDVDPVAYLSDILPRLSRGILLRDAPDLLPAAWKAFRAADVDAEHPATAA